MNENVEYGVKGVLHLFPEKLEKGVVRIDTIEKQSDPLGDMRVVMDAGAYWFRCKPGKYVRMILNGELMMSDTGMERYSNRPLIEKANGRVLIAGLGIGMLLHNILDKAEVTEVLVVEKYQDVIDLVAPKFKHPKLRIIHEDIDQFQLDKTDLYDTIYFDIWALISTKNLEHIKKLHNRFKYRLNRANHNCYMNSWMKEYLQGVKRKEDREYGGGRYW